MKVHLFFRKETQGFRSLEEIFDIVIEALKNCEIAVKEVPEKRINPDNFRRNLKWVSKERGVVNHITGDIHYVALATGKKTVLTVHDAYSLLKGNRFKRFFFKLFWFWLPALIVKRITTISVKSKKELIRLVPFARKKIMVIPNPYNPKLLDGDQKLEKALITDTSKPIVLHLGTKANKNLERTIRAMEGLPYKLYIIGQLTEKQANLLARHNIDFHSYFNLPYSEVAILYHQCTLVCFASLYEGFGMPIIEGQLVGKPVLTSNIDPMPWVAGEGGAHFVDPFSEEEIRDGITKVIEDEPYRNKIIEAGLKNVQRFEPGKIARMYEEVYRDVAG